MNRECLAKITTALASSTKLRILKIISSSFIICLIPFLMAAGQENKSEQRIKIIVKDGSGTKIVIDTLLKDSMMNDSIKLKDGKVIFIEKHSDDSVTRTKDGTEQVLVTVTSDGNDSIKEVKKVIIVSPDAMTNKKTDVEMTKYVISRDGMVISIEGNDYAKVKELVKVIENKLGK